MKTFTIIITGQCPDDIPDDWLAQMAGAAQVQVDEPEIHLDDPNPERFSTTNVTTELAINSLVRPFLDLNSSHLPQELGSFSEPKNVTAWDRFTIYNHPEYGFFIHVPSEEDMEDYDLSDTPPELLAVWAYARSIGCHYVSFDRDGAVDPHLPTWDW